MPIQGMVHGIIKPVAEGTPRPEFSTEDLHRWNAEAAQQTAAATREQAREILRNASAPAIAYVRGLSDEQLATSFDLPMRPEPITLDAMIEFGLIGHPKAAPGQRSRCSRYGGLTPPQGRDMPAVYSWHVPPRRHARRSPRLRRDKR